MEIEREVYDDLVTLVEAGLASPATQRLIERHKAMHPEWSAVAPPTPELPRVDAPPDVAREALERTQRLLSRRSWLMALAFFFSLSPLTFVASGKELRFLLYRDQPGIAAALFAIGLLGWAGYVWTNRRLARAGLTRAAAGRTRREP